MKLVHTSSDREDNALLDRKPVQRPSKVFADDLYGVAQIASASKFCMTAVFQSCSSWFHILWSCNSQSTSKRWHGTCDIVYNFLHQHRPNMPEWTNVKVKAAYHSGDEVTKSILKLAVDGDTENAQLNNERYGWLRYNDTRRLIDFVDLFPSSSDYCPCCGLLRKR